MPRTRSPIVPPSASPSPGRTRRVLTWIGIFITALAPLMAASSAFTALTSGDPLAGPAEAFLDLWFVPVQVSPVSLVGLILLLVGMGGARGVRRRVWLVTGLAVVGLAANLAITFATAPAIAANSMAASARNGSEAGMVAGGVLHVAALITLVVLALRWLRPSLSAWAGAGVALYAESLLIAVASSASTAVTSQLTGASPGNFLTSLWSDRLVWDVLGLVILVVVAARARRGVALVASTGTALVLVSVIAKVLAATGAGASAAGGLPGQPSPLTGALAVVSVVLLACEGVLLVTGIVLARRTAARTVG